MDYTMFLFLYFGKIKIDDDEGTDFKF